MIKGLQKMRFENHKLFLVLPVPTHPLKKIFLYFKLCFNLKRPLTFLSVEALFTCPCTKNYSNLILQITSFLITGTFSITFIMFYFLWQQSFINSTDHSAHIFNLSATMPALSSSTICTATAFFSISSLLSLTSSSVESLA